MSFSTHLGVTYEVTCSTFNGIEICDLLGYYVALSASFVPTFFPKRREKNYRSSPHSNPEKRKSLPRRSESLKSRN
jgi:hypothetical protein